MYYVPFFSLFFRFVFVYIFCERKKERKIAVELLFFGAPVYNLQLSTMHSENLPMYSTVSLSLTKKCFFVFFCAYPNIVRLDRPGKERFRSLSTQTPSQKGPLLENLTGFGKIDRLRSIEQLNQRTNPRWSIFGTTAIYGCFKKNASSDLSFALSRQSWKASSIAPIEHCIPKQNNLHSRLFGTTGVCA